MKAIVTGGTGFIGSSLIEKLVAKHYQVFCIAKDEMHATDLKALGVEIVLKDINDGVYWEPLLSDADYIFHVAGVTRAKCDSDYYDGNFKATRRIARLSAAICRKLKRFIYVSSLTAVGPSFDEKPIEENSPYHPVSIYGKSKMLGELEVLKLKDRLPFTILRPSGVYGPRDREMLSYISMIQKGIQPLIGFGTKWLNLIHRDDLVDGIIQAAESTAAENEIFFLGGEKNYTTEEIGDAIAAVLHKSRLKFPLPESLVYLIGSITETVGKISGQEVFFNRQKVAEAVQTYWTCSVAKAKARFGFQEKFSLQEGMQDTCRWYRQHQWLA